MLMLGMTSYGQAYIDHARAEIDRQVQVYDALSASGTGLKGAAKATFDAALFDFEAVYFTDLVLVLETYFMHRLRGKEGKDGNALNEVRLVAASLMSNEGRLAADKQIKLDPAKSVLGYQVGDQIAVREAEFVQLATAFFAEIDAKFA
jgi:hypothetical protein